MPFHMIIQVLCLKIAIMLVTANISYPLNNFVSVINHKEQAIVCS